MQALHLTLGELWKIAVKYWNDKWLKLIIFISSQWSSIVYIKTAASVVRIIREGHLWYFFFPKCVESDLICYCTTAHFDKVWFFLALCRRSGGYLQPRTKLLRQICLFSNINSIIGHCKTCTSWPPPHPHTMLFWLWSLPIQIVWSSKQHWKRVGERTDNCAVVWEVLLKTIEKYRRVFNLSHVILSEIIAPCSLMFWFHNERLWCVS